MYQINRIIVTIFLLTITIYHPSQAQKKIETEAPQQKAKRMEWWSDARFGMFIHWGLYSEAARHEWVKRWERMSDEQYQPYFDQFNPDLFNPRQWAKQAKAAGMKYAVLTTKHHEGFCLFDSKYTDYKAVNTPAKRDLVRQFVEAFRAEGIKVGFYYSLLDWHHPDFTVDVLHPLQPASNKDQDYDRLNKGRDMAKYRLYMKNQLRELLTNYGKIDILWLDFSYPDNGKHGKGSNDWGAPELLKEIRKLQPGILINNRLGLDDQNSYDFVTPEQVNPGELAKFKGKTWETCQTFSGSWGYFRDESTWKTNRQLLDLLITSVSNGGNLILNVGPTARGEFDYRATRALDSIALWMHANSKSVYHCSFAPDSVKPPVGTKLTYNGAAKRLYVHLYDYPTNGNLLLPGYGNKIKYARFLHDDSELQFKPSDAGANDLLLNLPVKKPGFEIPVVELVLR